MENLVITINGFEYVRKTDEQDLLDKIKRLEAEVAELEDEIGRALCDNQDLEEALQNILRIAGRAV